MSLLTALRKASPLRFRGGFVIIIPTAKLRSRVVELLPLSSLFRRLRFVCPATIDLYEIVHIHPVVHSPTQAVTYVCQPSRIKLNKCKML